MGLINVLKYGMITGWWFGTFGTFFHIFGIIIPSDFHIFQRGRYTTNQITYVLKYGMIIKTHQNVSNHYGILTP
jgi:hypothetical protein